MNLTINNQILDNLDFSQYSKVCPDYDTYYHFFNKKSGEAHYRLLAYISDQFDNSKITDIGTNKGASALAFSYNYNNKIFSFDIKDRFFFVENSQKFQSQKGAFYFYSDNVNFIVGNFYNFEDFILNSDIILYDTNHDGVLEREFIEYLVKNNYKGIVLIDDIKLNPEMIEFWAAVSIKKYDLTKYGNATGTGLIDFGGNLELTLT